MKGKSNTLTIVLGIVAVVLFFSCISGCSTYNNLVTESEEVDQSWAEVQTQYQRRLDLIPNLVSIVKGYAEHEKTTFENVTKARAGLDTALDNANKLKEGDMSNEEDFEKYTQAQSNLNKQMSLYINAVHEAYPDLKANEQFKDLQAQLEGTENRIAFARQQYTEKVKAYNVKVRKFPATIWASMFGFSAKPQYKADAEAQSAPRVEF